MDTVLDAVCWETFLRQKTDRIIDFCTHKYEGAGRSFSKCVSDRNGIARLTVAVSEGGVDLIACWTPLIRLTLSNGTTQKMITGKLFNQREDCHSAGYFKSMSQLPSVLNGFIRDLSVHIVSVYSLFRISQPRSYSRRKLYSRAFWSAILFSMYDPLLRRKVAGSLAYRFGLRSDDRVQDGDGSICVDWTDGIRLRVCLTHPSSDLSINQRFEEASGIRSLVQPQRFRRFIEWSLGYITEMLN